MSIRAEQRAELAADASKLQALLDAAVDGIVIIDEQGRIENFNKAAEAMFGFLASDLIGQNVSRLMPEPYSSEHDGYIARYLRTGDARIIGIGREVTGRRNDGIVFPIELSVGESVRSGERCFVGFIRDVTERKAIEERLRQQEEQLAHVTRLSTLGEMAAGIAHEINQPLTAISTYAEACSRLLAAGNIEPDELRTTLERISQQALRAGEVIRRLRRLAQRGTSGRDVIDVGTTVEETLRLAEADARAFGMTIQLDCESDLPPVIADPVQIQQVVLNLLRNALESLEEANNRTQPIRIEVRGKAPDDIVVRVTDYGVGIRDEHRAHLFEPFHTTKDAGMGIGLAISRTIITAHGGELSFKPNPEGGAVFEFTLPTTIGVESNEQ